MPSACEVDVMGALSMYALALASGAPPAILDWNNNYADEADKCVVHPLRQLPKSFIGDTPEIGELDVLGEVIGRAEMLRRGQGQGQGRADDLFPGLVATTATARSRPISARASSPTTPSPWTAASRSAGCRTCGG